MRTWEVRRRRRRIQVREPDQHGQVRAVRGRIGERRCVDQEVQGQECLRHRSKPMVWYTPFEALKLATHDKAHLLKLSGDLGVVKEGAVSYTHLRAHETPEHLVC